MEFFFGSKSADDEDDPLSEEEEDLPLEPVIIRSPRNDWDDALSLRTVGSLASLRDPSGSIRLCTSSDESQQIPMVPGFVDGNFCSGKILDLKLPSVSFVMAYYKTILVVGMEDMLAFYDASHGEYALVHTVPSDHMISAVRWIPPRPIDAAAGSGGGDNDTTTLLLATADLGGCAKLYSIDLDIFDLEGPSLIFTYHMEYEIRSLDAGYCQNAGSDLLVVATGDKSGVVTLSSFQWLLNLMHLHTLNLPNQEKGGILGLALHLERPDGGYLATCTTEGFVHVVTLANALVPSSSSIEPNSPQQQQQPVFTMQRSGACRCVRFHGNLLAIGGADKTVVLVCTQQWVVARELPLEGTVNTIEFDPMDRYVGVGCRDKSFTVFDTSTFVAIKVFHTPSWVTAICWGERDTVAIRSETRCLSILDLAPIQQTNIELDSGGSATSLSWSHSGQFLARTVGSRVVVVDSTLVDDDNSSFREVCGHEVSKGALATKVVFCQAPGMTDLLAVVDDSGSLTVLRLRDGYDSLKVEKTVSMAPTLTALAWSQDGKYIATGGKDKHLLIFSAPTLTLIGHPIEFLGRIWDVDFVPTLLAGFDSSDSSKLLLAVAVGDYTTTLIGATTFDPVLQIFRTRTCRCLKFHPTIPLLAIGDGAGTVAIIDYEGGELLHEMNVGGRVNDVNFSALGDFFVVGTDDFQFSMYETVTYRLVQEVPSKGFALNASFSPRGLYLALGDDGNGYRMMCLGPFLGVDLTPLSPENGVHGLPGWALKEVLFRSSDGPSYLQRLMVQGGPENLSNVSALLKKHPNAIYTFDSRAREGCFDTALRLKKPSLLKTIVVCVVDGTLDPSMDREKNFLTTNIPQSCRETLVDIVQNYPPEYIVEIFNKMTFMKVPFASQVWVESGDRIECGSTSFTDPWSNPDEGCRQLHRSSARSRVITRGGTMRTPAVLPIPGLGDMDFLSSLLSSAPSGVFNSDALDLVLRVLWAKHIRKYYYLDCFLFVVFYSSWVALVECASALESLDEKNKTSTNLLAALVLILNAVYTIKELIEGRYRRRQQYWKSIWNAIDYASIICVYGYTVDVLVTGDSFIPLAVVTTLVLTVRLLSYLRGFSDTGWLISVLIANFRDVRGFLIIIGSILAGFSVAFRLLLGATGDESFATLRRSILSTFELTVTGSYDPDLLFETRYSTLAVITFVLAITCILVVALNSLISILADSYARVQSKGVAGRRREMATLIVEYMSILRPWKRRQIEEETRWVHRLLEVDASGRLQVAPGDWEGGLNSLRRDMGDLSKANRMSYEKSLEKLKLDLDTDIEKFKKQVVSLLKDLTDDVKHLRKDQQNQGVLHCGGRRKLTQGE